jgi:hypothetical protein
MKLIKDLDIREVQSKNGNTKRYRYSLFRCPRCGNEVERKKHDGLKQQKCCGGKSKYFKKGSPLHIIYSGMIQRCKDENAINYKNYGGKGISVCEEWSNFDNFCKWALSNGYKQGLSIERKNNNDGYSSDNCIWIERSHQARNTSNNIHSVEDIKNIKKDYVTTLMTFKDISEKYNDSEGNIGNIINGKIWSDIETEYDKYIDTVKEVKQKIKGEILSYWTNLMA